MVRRLCRLYWLLGSSTNDLVELRCRFGLRSDRGGCALSWKRCRAAAGQDIWQQSRRKCAPCGFGLRLRV